MLSLSSESSPLLDGKIEQAIKGIEKSYGDKLHSIGENNSLVVADYIAAMNTEINLSPNYRGDNIEALTRFSRYNDNRSFKELKRDDIIAFLDSLRKTEERDPMHKWVGTYNLHRIYLLRFFKWLYYSPRNRTHDKMRASLFKGYGGEWEGSNQRGGLGNANG